MDVMIAIEETKLHGVDPALEIDANARVAIGRHDELALEDPVFGPAARLHRESSGRAAAHCRRWRDRCAAGRRNRGQRLGCGG